jgi:hypothetical protein
LRRSTGLACPSAVDNALEEAKMVDRNQTKERTEMITRKRRMLSTSTMMSRRMNHRVRRRRRTRGNARNLVRLNINKFIGSPNKK